MTTASSTDGPERRDTSTSTRRRSLHRARLAAGCALTFALLATACDSSGGSGGESSPGGSVTTGGTTRAASTVPSTPSQPASTSTTSTGSATRSSGADQQSLDAGATARDKLGRGTVTSLDLEQGGTVWEVEIITRDGVEYELRVSRDGSTVISGPRALQPSAAEKKENQHAIRTATLDYRRAARTILSARGGTITELNLDDRRGDIVWEADVMHEGTKYEVIVNAATGKIIRNKPDHD